MPDHEHEHGHDHGGLTLTATEASDEDIAALGATRPEAAEAIELSRRFSELTPAEKARLQGLQEALLQGPWVPGFHAEGDVCCVCDKPTHALWRDRVTDHGSLAWAAFKLELPVHPGCAAGFAARFPRLSRRDLDAARRKTLATLRAPRPTPEGATFFRRDLLETPNLDPAKWAEATFNEHAETAEDPKALARDLERLVSYVHAAVFH